MTTPGVCLHWDSVVGSEVSLPVRASIAASIETRKLLWWTWVVVGRYSRFVANGRLRA